VKEDKKDKYKGLQALLWPSGSLLRPEGSATEALRLYY
jgi:hypothetical protein